MYGLDQPERSSRLALLGLSASDQSHALRLQAKIIAPNIESIIDRFYGDLQKQAQFIEIIQRGNYSIEALKKTQRQYMLSLGVGFDTPEYCEERLRVGLAHAKVGVPLGLYQSVYSLLQRIIIGKIQISAENQQERDDLTDFLLKITNLDMTLAIETYHQKRVEGLESSVSTLTNERVMLRQKAETDPLTKLANHGHIVRQLEVVLKEHQQQDKPLCIIMADLDHFKEVNDIHGHLSGDVVLKDVAARMISAVRSFDMVGRYGGEEFVIILQNTNLEVARVIAERIRHHIASAPINVQGNEIPMTISEGLVIAQPVEDYRQLLERADQALYAAKKAGRNCVVVHDSAGPL
jgi:diguanylate cyclase (GGDEF)-like protein